MRPREKSAAEIAEVSRPRTPMQFRPDWNEKNEDQVESLKAVRASMIGQSLVNYATAPLGAKKYEASTLSR